MISVLEYAAGILLAIFVAVVAIELAGWSKPAAQAMIRWAASRLPETKRERWHEEWLADLDHVEGRPLLVLAHAACASLGAVRLARELRPSVDVSRNREGKRDKGEALSDVLLLALEDPVGFGAGVAYDLLLSGLEKTGFVPRDRVQEMIWRSLRAGSFVLFLPLLPARYIAHRATKT